MQSRSKRELVSHLRDISKNPKSQESTRYMSDCPTLVNTSQGPLSPNHSMQLTHQGMWHHASSVMRLHRNKQKEAGTEDDLKGEDNSQVVGKKGKSGYKITHRSQRNTIKNGINFAQDKICTNDNARNRPVARCFQGQNYLRQREEEVQKLRQELKQVKGKLKQEQRKNSNLTLKMSKHTTDVKMLLAMTQKLQRQQRGGMVETGAMVCHDSEDRQLAVQAAELNQWLANDTKQKEKVHLRQTYKLQSQLAAMGQECDRLKEDIISRDMKIDTLERQINTVEVNTSLHERLLMCQEELQTFKLKYKESKMEMLVLAEKNQSMREKLKAMTSLIGCAIIFDMNQKERDKQAFRQFMNRLNQHQWLTHNLVDSAFNNTQIQEYLRRNKGRDRLSQEEEEIKEMQRTAHYKPLYYPNYLALIGQDSIVPSSEPAVVGPALFIKLRAILDAKYIDYRVHGHHSAPFSNFVSSHIKHYQVSEADKVMHLMTRQPSEAEIKMGHVDFFQNLLEPRIMDLPEVEVFREFLMSRYQEDEVFFYLLCRHKFLQGSELESFINCGDPSKLLLYDGPKKRLLARITARFGRSVQNYVCWHVNERTVTKGRRVFVRVYYLLKVLLMVYRKSRLRQISQFKTIFESQYSLADTVPFFQFTEIVKKNFEFMSRMEICQMYKHTTAVYESQKSKHSKTTFFECFVACCVPQLFLEELRRYDKQLEAEGEMEEQISDARLCLDDSISVPVTSKSIKLTKVSIGNDSKLKEHSRKNTHFKTSAVSELWPNAVYSLGNEELNLAYNELLRGSHKQLRNQTQTLRFLSTLVECHVIREQHKLPMRKELTGLMTEVNDRVVEWLNGVERQRLERQKQLNMASGKIGRFFKNKTYQFYNEMLEDINTASKEARAKAAASSNTVNSSEGGSKKKKGKYMKEKTRVSRMLLASHNSIQELGSIKAESLFSSRQ